MTVRPHMSQHELAEELPLLSETATVTAVDAMDHPRHDEVVEAIERTLRIHGKAGWMDVVNSERATVDWARLWALVHRDSVGGRADRVLRTLQERYERDYPSLVRVQFDPDAEFDFVPGEYLTVHYQHIPRPYSIASAPSREEIELCVRRVPGGHMTTLLCDELAIGDHLTIRGPFGGDFVLQEPSHRDIVFLATGSGVAPFKSMIDYLFEEGFDEYEGENRDIWLFLGASWVDDIPYYDAFRQLSAAHDNFHFVPTASRESYLSDWDGETAYVQQILLKYLNRGTVTPTDIDSDLRPFLEEDPEYDIDVRLDPNEMEVYACGINAMVYSLVTITEQLGVPERDIRSEGYG